jgi:hypothetical protein
MLALRTAHQVLCSESMVEFYQNKWRGIYKIKIVRKINTNFINFIPDCLIETLTTDPEARVRFPALPHFLRSSGSGTGSTQPREYN